MLSFGPDGGKVSVIANPSTVAPPGACVAVPQVTHSLYVTSTGIDQLGEIHEAMTRWGYHTVRLADVDGDGLLDAFVPIAKPNDCPEDIQWRVFVMRGACGHDVGVVGKGTIAPDAMGAGDGSGFRPIVVTSSSTGGGMSVIPKMTDTTTSFAFSPKLGRYVRRGVKSRSGVCHHCALWSCVLGP
jgi:hypothetical protein